MFKIVRAGKDYDFVILMSPENAPVKSQDAVYYRYTPQLKEGKRSGRFLEIPYQNAMNYFSEDAEMYLGFEKLPLRLFGSVEVATAYVERWRFKHRAERRRPGRLTRFLRAELTA